jgi:CxxC motif-containing protein (DUF1111 family)
MPSRLLLILGTAVALAGLATCASERTEPLTIVPSDYHPGDERSGGAATVHDVSPDAFALAVPGLDRSQRRAFAVGNSFFNDAWVVAPASAAGRDGLGPLFNATSCSGCHFRDGRGRPPAVLGGPLESLLVRLSVPGPGGAIPHPVYGEQFQDKAIPGVPREGGVRLPTTAVPGRFADGTGYVLHQPRIELFDLGYGPLPAEVQLSARVAPAVFGAGLIQALDEAGFRAREQAQVGDPDGVSGRIRWVIEPRSGQLQPGRFGWKAGAVTVEQQSAGAFAGDLGITSSLQPRDHATEAQTAARAAPHGGEPELSEHKLQRISEYQRFLAVPAQRAADTLPVRRGEALFRALRCDACHTPTLVTGPVADAPVLARQTIHPYSDFLLHDLGEGLADHRPEGTSPTGADGREWRTPALWGLGLIPVVNGHQRLLHDGRADGPQEAILWHGGEAEAARERYRRLPIAQREDLLAFLQSL